MLIICAQEKRISKIYGEVKTSPYFLNMSQKRIGINPVIMRVCGILYLFCVTPSCVKRNCDLFFVGFHAVNRQFSVILRKGHRRADNGYRNHCDQCDTKHNMPFCYYKEFHKKPLFHPLFEDMKRGLYNMCYLGLFS